MPAVEFFYDFNSPNSYLAATQIRGLAERCQATIVYRPFVLGGVFKATGNHSPLTIPAKRPYEFKDLVRWARYWRVPMVPLNPLEFRSISALRAALAAEEQGKIAEFTHAAFHASWGTGRDLGNIDELARVIAEMDLDPKAILARIEQQDVKDRLRAQTDEAVRRGAFGAPTFFVGDEMFVGKDRLMFVEMALRG